ncbi:hypothetical protein [Streptomyces sp. NPDC127084]|uniref:hypothetical protein n=1 Tax=Streptomyces sp. NPDC127084 TaxID=3347133 RepID=UPI003657839D
MTTTRTHDDDVPRLNGDPQELASFIAARIADAEQQADRIAVLEAAGSVLAKALSSAHLRAEAAAKKTPLDMHPGATDRRDLGYDFCPGCVGPRDTMLAHDSHCRRS